MAAFTGKFEYHAAGRGAVQEGSVHVSFDQETLTLVGARTPLAFDLGDIDVIEPGEYELRLVLYTGDAIRLRQFGKSFQDLERQLVEAYRDRLVKCLLVSDLDEVARYTGRIRLQSSRRTCEGTAEIRLFDSNLAILPDAAAGFQWRLAEIDAVEFDEREYSVVLQRRDERLSIGRLAKRTGELAERLRERIDRLQERSAHVLHAVFPFLAPEQFRHVAATMREGASASIGELRCIHRLIQSSLLEKVVDGGLRPYLRALLERTPAEHWYAGFKIIRKDVEANHDDAAAGEADGADEEPAEDARPDGEAAGEPDPAVTEAGNGLEVLYWFFVPVSSRRSDGRSSHLAWEATSRGGRATYIFALPDERADPQRVGVAVRAINDGLVALNFRREPIYLKSDSLESVVRYRHYAIAVRTVPELAVVRGAFIGRAIHRSLPAWRTQLDALLSR